MPHDILRIIARYVAVHPGATRDNDPAFISPHLFKFRLISRACANIGLEVMKTIVRRDDEFRNYRVLYIPLNDFSLSRARQTLLDPGFHTIVDTIEVQPFSVPTHDIGDIEAERNEEIKVTTYGDLGVDEPDPLEELQEELLTFLRQCGQQETFLESIATTEGKKNLDAVLLALPKRLKLNVKVFEYFMRDTLLGLAKKHEIAGTQKRAMAFHWNVLPVVSQILNTCDIASMYLTAGSCLFQDMTRSDVSRASSGMQSLVSLQLEMSRLDFLLDGTWTRNKPLEGATSFSDFLACAKNLQALVICYHELEQREFKIYMIEYDKQWPPAFEDSFWTAEVLQSQSWAKLRTFELRDFKSMEKS